MLPKDGRDVCEKRKKKTLGPPPSPRIQTPDRLAHSKVWSYLRKSLQHKPGSLVRIQPVLWKWTRYLLCILLPDAQ